MVVTGGLGTIATVLALTLLLLMLPPLRAKERKQTPTYETVGKLSIQADVYREDATPAGLADPTSRDHGGFPRADRSYNDRHHEPP